MSNFIIRTLSRLALPISLLLAAGTAFAGQEFNFAYATTGERDLKPVQVFDDGEKTYLQMKGSLVPAVFVDVGGRSVMLQAKQKGEFLLIPAVAKEMTIRFASLSARVIYTGGGRVSTLLAKDALMQPDTMAVPSPGALARPPVFAPTVFGASKPRIGDAGTEQFVERDAQIAFAKGKSDLSKDAAAKILQSLAGSGAVSRVVITGRDDQAYVEGLARGRAIAIRDRVLAAGVPIERVILKEGVARDSEAQLITSDIVVTWRTVSDTPVQTASETTSQQTLTKPLKNNRWVMAKEDKNVASMLSKWVTAEGMNLVWKSSEEIDITGDATIMADNLMEAVDIVVAQSNKFGYPISVHRDGKTLIIK